MVKPTYQLGFTLVELLITVAILTLLLTLAVPMTTRWSNDAQTLRAKSTVERAFQQTKAIALRNPNGITDSTAGAASLVLTDGALLVCTGAASACVISTDPDVPSPVVWSETLPAQVRVVLSSTSTCTANATVGIDVNNRGLRLATTNYKVCQGAENANIEL